MSCLYLYLMSIQIHQSIFILYPVVHQGGTVCLTPIHLNRISSSCHRSVATPRRGRFHHLWVTGHRASSDCDTMQAFWLGGSEFGGVGGSFSHSGFTFFEPFSFTQAFPPLSCELSPHADCPLCVRCSSLNSKMQAKSPWTTSVTCGCRTTGSTSSASGMWRGAGPCPSGRLAARLPG